MSLLPQQLQAAQQQLEAALVLQQLSLLARGNLAAELPLQGHHHLLGQDSIVQGTQQHLHSLWVQRDLSACQDRDT